MSRKSENVESPKTDSPDLIPEGFGGAQGTPGDPWEPLKHPKTLEIPGFPGFREFSLNSPVGPYWALRALASVRRLFFSGKNIFRLQCH